MDVAAFIRIRNKLLIAAAFIAVFVLLGLRLAMPINLTAVDIGRHIKNGELILHGQRDILFKNYYSFTFPEYPFINHHWFFGVLCYALYKCWDFIGVQYCYIGLCVLGLFFFVRAALLRGHGALVLFFACLALPLLWDRREIRPEGVSICFMGVYTYVLTALSMGRVKPVFVSVLLLLVQVIWVNSHIFFFMGPVLTAVFLWDGSRRGCSVCVRHLRPLLFWVTLVNIVNPSGLAGALTPFNIFKGLGYRLAENQNVFFMMGKFFNPTYPYFLLVIGTLIAGAMTAVRQRGLKSNLPMLVLTVFVVLAGLSAIRLMMPLGYFVVVLGPLFWGQVQGALPHQQQRALRSLLGIAACLVAAVNFKFFAQPELGVGLSQGVNASAQFYKGAGLKGPIFSNYDIGGYLIYHLAPGEKVFVDNRQEAFPPEFFKNVYIPMQDNKEMWAKMEQQYGFNVIYFYRHDLTPWGQDFLVARIQDPLWAPVFVDGYAIIFLKRNAQNAALISRFELPQAMFSVRKN